MHSVKNRSYEDDGTKFISRCCADNYAPFLVPQATPSDAL